MDYNSGYNTHSKIEVRFGKCLDEDFVLNLVMYCIVMYVEFESSPRKWKGRNIKQNQLKRNLIALVYLVVTHLCKPINLITNFNTENQTIKMEIT